MSNSDHSPVEEPGFFDRTMRKGRLVRCTACVMIAISWLIFVIGFVTAVYGLRLGSQEYAQMQFLRGELGNATLTRAWTR